MNKKCSASYMTVKTLVYQILVLTSTLIGCSGFGHDGEPAVDKPSVSMRKLLEDIDSLLVQIDLVHADPYRFISKSELVEYADSIKERIRRSKPMSIPICDAYVFLQDVVARLQDQHTNVVFPFHCIDVQDQFIPFAVNKRSDKVYLSEKWTACPIPLFAEIVDINGKNVSEFDTSWAPLFKASLPRIQSNLFETFFQLYITKLAHLTAPWDITYRKDGSLHTLAVEGISGIEFYAYAMPSRSYCASTTAVDGLSIPTLIIPNFAVGAERAFHEFVDKFFYLHRDSPYLAIDLRNNKGGNGDWGYYLLDHLTDTTYKVADSFTIKVSSAFRGSMYSLKIGDKLTAIPDGAMVTREDFGMRMPDSKTGKYEGRVFLFISRKTFSAGAVTAAIFKASEMGIVIGEETCGLEKFCSDPVSIRLPGSGLSVSIPTAIYDLPGSSPDRGIVPHVDIDSHVDNIRNGVDPYLTALANALGD